MRDVREVLDQISMVTANFGEAAVLADVVQDWFNFLGGKPGEVVVVDCGSSPETQNICWNMFQKGMIDKLQVIHDSNEDFGRDKGYIKEYTAGAIASKPYVLLFKTDTLPFREGHENWLAEAISYLDRDDVFAISGSWNLPSKHRDAWDGWYFSHLCSYNFALMKRSTFMAAAHEFAHEFIVSGFKGENPADKTEQGRYFIEVAFEQYMQNHNLYVLSKVEDSNWTVFHTNTHDQQLKKAREKYLKRQDIQKYMDLGNSLEPRDPGKALYYGVPSPNLLRRFQIAIGASSIGPYWRSLKTMLAKRGVV